MSQRRQTARGGRGGTTTTGGGGGKAVAEGAAAAGAGAGGGKRKRRLVLPSDEAAAAIEEEEETVTATGPVAKRGQRGPTAGGASGAAPLEEENWADEEEEEERGLAAREVRGAKRQHSSSGVEEYAWEAKWPIYGLAWAQGATLDGTARPLRLAVGSFLEDRCSNKVAVVDFDANRGEFTVRAEFMHGYAATKLMWRPEDLTGDAADLLATSGDYLRLWHVPNDGVQELDWRVRGAVTSFDWSAVEANLIATAHFNGTMNLWDISSRQVLDQVEVHQGEVYDVAFNQKSGGRFLATASADGSVRLWDRRNGFEKAQTLLECRGKGFFRVAWNPENEHVLVAAPMGSSTPVTVDIRFPLAVAAELRGHTGPVNALVWSPYPSNANQLLTGGDDHTLNLWSVNSSPTRRTLEPMRQMHATEEINNIAWNAQEPFAAVAYHRTVLAFPL